MTTTSPQQTIAVLEGEINRLRLENCELSGALDRVGKHADRYRTALQHIVDSGADYSSLAEDALKDGSE